MMLGRALNPVSRNAKSSALGCLEFLQSWSSVSCCRMGKGGRLDADELDAIPDHLFDFFLGIDT